jgi:hypothetical protein
MIEKSPILVHIFKRAGISEWEKGQIDALIKAMPPIEWCGTPMVHPMVFQRSFEVAMLDLETTSQTSPRRRVRPKKIRTRQ